MFLITFSEQVVLLNLHNLELLVNVNEVLFHLGPTLTFKLVAHILFGSEYLSSYSSF